MEAAAPRPRRPWILPLVLASVVVFLGSATATHLLVTGTLGPEAQAPTPSPTGPVVATVDQPLITGDAGTAVAVEPVVCPDACFDDVSILDLTMDEWDFDRLGLAEPELSDADRQPVAMSEVMDDPPGDFPEECSFAANAAPGAVLPGDESSTDLVFRTGVFEDLDGIDRGEQWARLFAGSAEATAHLAALESSIASCVAVTADSDGAVITAAPALELPDSVAVLGWVRTSEEGPGWREYVYDIQSANAVIRVRLLTDGSITEQRFRSAVQAYTGQVGFNAPRPGEGGAQ